MSIKISARDREWQSILYEKAKNLAGKRYTPEINVDLPIGQTFDGLARNRNFYVRVRKVFGELRKSRNDIFPRSNPELLGMELLNFDYTFEELLSLLDQIKEYSNTQLPWDKIKDSKTKLEDLGWKLQSKIHEVQNGPDNDKKDVHSEKIFASESNYISRFVSTLHGLEQLATSDAAKLSNNPFMLLMGVTGIGKTHLLCDLVKTRIDASEFSFIALGQEINDTEDIWKQIVNLNKDSRYKSKANMLKKYDSLGKRTKSRFFIIIDALNETPNPRFWKIALPILIKEIKKYKNISLVVSVRSGFEKEVLTAKSRRKFYEVEHVGFRFREWEAIKAFFTQYGLPLHEIPLINPEFSVPLFLLLFCKSRLRRAKKKDKQLFRGHEGSTSIFEDFIKGVSENIGTEFKIGTVDKVWNKLIKPIAEGMVNNRGEKDKINEIRFKKIIATEFPGINFGLLASSLERNNLLIRVPRYGKKGKRVGFDYRFTYQRFSDHLIARYLMNKYADTKVLGIKAKDNLKNKLRKNGTLGKLLIRYSFSGVMSALSIQIPERLKGIELIDLCPWARQMLEEPFLESIIWRDPKAFYLDNKGKPTRTIKIINKLILPSDYGPSRFFSAVMNVSGVPDHPFNALRIHSYLMKIGMAVRDDIWGSFLHYDYGENGSVDRLLHWVLSASFNKAIANSPKLLMATTLTWFFSSSNRSIRDKATKGLVILLEDSPSVLLELHKLFESVDDPYVKERLYAASYGVILRLSNYNDPSLKVLGKLIYKNIFSAGKPTPHILIRDYAKCILDIFKRRKVYIPPIKISITQNTKWPSKLPTIKTLEEKHEPKGFSWDKASYQDRGIQAIWNSFDGIADFFRYIVEPAINHWSNTKIGMPMPPTKKELESKLIATLNKDQLKLYKQIKSFFPLIRISRYLDIEKKIFSPEEKAKAEEENKLEKSLRSVKKSFWDSLSQEQKGQYRKILRLTEYLYPRKTGYFDSEMAKRWIIKRVFELYRPEMHGHFDGSLATNYDHGRDDHPVERIGKKYQWIALHELLGHLADNFRFIKKDYPPEAGKYKGAWQINIRDIDPSCTAFYKPSIDKTLWKPAYDAWRVKESTDKWLKRKADLPNPKGLFIYTDPQGVEWYILTSFYKWEQDIPPEEERYHYPSRDIFYIINSYFIENANQEKLFKWYDNQNFYGRWMPETRNGIQEVYFREYPYSPIYEAFYGRYDESSDGWISKVGYHKKMPGRIMLANDEFSLTGASRDKSVDDSFSISLPSKGLVKMLGLKQSSTDGFWQTKRNNEVCGDLSIREGGETVLAIKKNALLRLLKAKKLSLIWTLLGEKAVIGEEREKLRELSGAYLLKSDGTVTGRLRFVPKDARH